MLYREPKLLKQMKDPYFYFCFDVSVLYREPKLLKRADKVDLKELVKGFSALP